MTANHTTYSTTKLKARFYALWNRCLLPAMEAIPVHVWQDLIRHYAEPHRRYHTASHLAYCLQQLDLAKSLMEDPEAVEMAIWFHDVVNNPDAHDNEQRSEELFERAAGSYFEQGFVNKVSALILATAHREVPHNLDERFICDIDFSSFGFPWEQFLWDCDAIRAEQAKSPDELFYAAKLKFLKGLLKRPTIFLTEFFHARYESTARDNIQRYIARLEAD